MHLSSSPLLLICRVLRPSVGQIPSHQRCSHAAERTHEDHNLVGYDKLVGVAEWPFRLSGWKFSAVFAERKRHEFDSRPGLRFANA